MMTNLLFSQARALGKRLAMVLTMLLIVGVGQAWGETVADEITFGNPGDKNNYEAIKLTKEGTFTDHNNFIWSCSSDAAISNGGGALSACYSYAGNKNTSSSYIEISWTADKDYNVTQFDLNAYANGDNPLIILTIDEQVSTITAPKSKGTTFYSFSTNNFLVQLQKGKKITARIQKDASKAVTGIVALKYTFVECTTKPSKLATPTELNVTNITSTSATLSWGKVADASSYTVFITDLNDEEITLTDIEEMSVDVTGLSPETTYLWYVVAIGDGTNYTDSEHSSQTDPNAEFTTASATCTVTYDANEGEGTITDATEYTNGATVTVLGNYGKLTKDGYAFTGWNTAANGTGTPYEAGGTFTISANTTLYAQWCKAYWKLVTKASELENDTRIVIAAKDYNFALSTTQNDANREQATIEKKYNTISQFDGSTQILSLVDVTNNRFALYTGTQGYLYAASNSANQLKTKEGFDLNGNSDWSIAIYQGVATILAQGTYTNNELKYNSTSSLFSCYGSGNSQKDVVIYKEVCVRDQYNVTPNLTNATAKTNPTTVAASATSLTLNYSANTGYLLPETITVKMGGVELVSGTDYTWNKETGVLAINVDGFFGDIDVKIVAEVDPCYGFVMSEVTATSTTNSITLNWTAVDGATGYNIKIGTGEFTAANGLTHTFEGLSSKTTYTWEVQAVKDGDGFHCEASKTGSTTTQKESFTITWIANGQPHSTQTAVEGTALAIPTAPAAATYACDDKVFVGWTETQISGSKNTKPTDLFTTKSATLTANKTYYAVFATASESTTIFKRMQTLDELNTASKIAIINAYSSSTYILNTSLTSAATTPKESSGKITVTEGQYWTLEKSNSYWKFKNSDNQYLTAQTIPTSSSKSGSVQLATSGNNEWVIANNTYTNNGTPVFTIYNASSTKAGLEYSNGWILYYSTDFNTSWFTLKLYIPDVSYSEYVTTCAVIPDPVWSGAEIDNATINVNCGETSPMNSAAKISFPADKNYDLTYDITVTASDGFLVSTYKTDNAAYGTRVTVSPVKEGENAGKITQNVYVRAVAPANSGEDFTGTITLSGKQLAENQVINVTADVTCTTYTLTLNDRGTKTAAEYYAGASVPKPADPEGVCTEPIHYVFDGWATAPVTNGTEEYEKVDFSTFTMPNNNTTILYAVYRYAEDGGEPVNGFVKVKKSRDDWTGNYVIVNEDAKKAIGNSYNNSNTLTAVDVRIESEEVISPTDEVIWQIRKDEDNYTMYNTVAGKYAYIIGADSKNAGLSDSKQNITVSWGSSASTIRVCGSGDYTNRCFSYFSDKTEWRTYSTSGNSTGTLYRQTDKIILYTSSLICGSITAEDAVVTSTKEQPVKVNVPITLESSNGTTTITASSDNTAFTVVGLTDVEAGEHTIVVEYTPTDYNTTETANISLTATNGATATFKVTGYSLPEKFAVVVEKDGKYFALPANMPSAGTYAGYEVEVKDNAVTSAPTTYVYSLSAVHSTRYADHGTAVRFVGNDDKCLWASTSKNAPTSIRNYAEADNAKSEQYEWTLYTEDGVTYTITSTTTAGRQLRMKGDNFGQYASGANTFRFLPIETKTYTPTALSSKFSVAKDKKVQFSAGNLQYHTGDNAWRFAEQQYQYMGDNNKNISTPDFNDWIDMFGWSADGKYGVNASENNADYQGTFVDWGTLFPGDWYTLSKDEWIYLLHSRASASQLKQLAKVGDVYGVLLFPDEWVMPNDITPSMEDTYSTYTLDQWEQLEAAGAVFLPAAGRRIGNDQVNTNYYTYYWTNTKEAENKVYYLINCNALGNDQYEYALPQLWYEKGYYGQSVRLVRECIEPEKPQALSATFSVSATEQVQFSAGNLQYHTGEQVWRFAPEQYDVVGQPNTNIGNPNFKDWVDMFGWSADGNFGVNPSNNQDDYKQEFLDWGKVFSEDEYGVSADEWYTLSKDEWNYLLYTRPNASSLKQVAIVGEMIGVLLFPDNWVMPAGVTTSMQIDADGVEYYPYTLDQWKQLEAAGAVFLPAAGRRTGGWGNTTVSPHIEDKENPDNFDSEGYYRWQDNTNYYGYYWTSTKDDSDGKSYFLITCKMSDDGETGNPSLPSLWKEDGRYGQSVRLVRKCAQLQVVEWKENSIVIMYNGDPAQTATVTINNEQKGIATLSDSEVARDIAVYELPATGLASSPNQPLEIAIGNAKALMTIPYIATGNATDAPANSDLVILKDATYTVNGEQLRNVTVYGGGKLVVGNGASLSTSTLTLRIGGVKDGNYDYVYPQFILNGTWTNTSGKINLDYLTTKEQYYTFVAPFAVNTKDIKYPVDIYGSNVAPDNTGSFEFQYYDGAARAEGKTGWTVVPEGDDGADLEAGQGYTFLGMPKKVIVNGGSSTRQTFGIHRIPMTVAAGTAMTHENSEQSITVAPHPSEKNNNSGWNLIGNPYMSTIVGLTNEDIQVGKLVHTTDANGNWTGGWHWDTSTEATNQRFLVIPSNDGQSYEAVQASNAKLPAFKNFFVQISNEGANALSIPRTTPAAQLLAPARRTEEVVKDVEVAIVLEQDEAHTDQIDFLINNIYTEDFERDADFTKMMNATNLNLYGVHPYDNLSFVAIDNNTARGSVAIGYQVPQAGEYTLRMSDKPYVMFDRIEALYVTDHEMSPEVTTDIMSEPYRFTVANAETNHTRFTVSVILKTEEDDGGGDVGTGVDNTTNNNTPCKFIYQDKMYILRNGVIYDAMGKQVQTINK